MGLPNILRQTRGACGLSQLDLAADINVSQRHVSFLESGRARPSRDLLIAWMHRVNASASIRNAALLEAGYAPTGTQPGGKGTSKHCLTALRRVIAAYQPFPGFVLTSDMTLAAWNDAGDWLFSTLMPDLWDAGSDERVGLDMIAALSRPEGLLSRALDRRKATAAILEQLHLEAWLNPGLRPRVDALAAWLKASTADAPNISNAGIDPEMPLAFGTTYVPLTFQTDHSLVSFLRVQGVFELPQDVTASSLRVELWLPNDDRTRALVTGLPAQQIASL
ncbi:helix-turn-helix domain-containing protein [Ensifer sp. ENS02]|uniref:MmyB family transcriptional regulator n=1 Tax=Ensifer sp. ENS02 TaxID=2769290 RepID=UPI001786C03F|nr:helix-turn-helix domain-containing protein [Ensifer sp. ENS02]MBD9524713.1 helix-turn-helix domain-containing protein [Ensifer sp. ENS02]